jgi:hypothetical protein
MEPSKFLVQMDSTAQYPVPRNSSSSDKFSANNKSPITSLQDPMLYLDRVVSKSKLEASPSNVPGPMPLSVAGLRCFRFRNSASGSNRDGGAPVARNLDLWMEGAGLVAGLTSYR